ncbi:unnamed protein product, partial [Brugia timori]|uniref:Oleate hydratase n=1 Tax=Brugia timori TaxID=42155 RepID=A0A0R3QGG0_9BILA
MQALGALAVRHEGGVHLVARVLVDLLHDRDRFRRGLDRIGVAHERGQGARLGGHFGIESLGELAGQLDALRRTDRTVEAPSSRAALRCINHPRALTPVVPRLDPAQGRAGGTCLVSDLVPLLMPSWHIRIRRRVARPHSPAYQGHCTMTSFQQACIVGSGIGALSAAVLLIRDAGMPGSRIRILEEAPTPGGALDGTGNAAQGYVTRGGRMFTDETYSCLWNVLQSIPALSSTGHTVRDEIQAFNALWRSDAHARLINRDRRILDASDLGFNFQDRVELMRLLATPERALGTRRIEECFSTHFLDTHFWAMWRTTFAFQNWHSAVELKRYMLRFLQELPRIHTLGGVRRTEF